MSVEDGNLAELSGRLFFLHARYDDTFGNKNIDTDFTGNCFFRNICKISSEIICLYMIFVGFYYRRYLFFCNMARRFFPAYYDSIKTYCKYMWRYLQFFLNYFNELFLTWFLKQFYYCYKKQKVMWKKCEILSK